MMIMMMMTEVIVILFMMSMTNVTERLASTKVTNYDDDDIFSKVYHPIWSLWQHLIQKGMSYRFTHV